MIYFQKRLFIIWKVSKKGIKPSSQSLQYHYCLNLCIQFLLKNKTFYTNTGNSGLPRNSPGMMSGAPYTAPETERLESSLGNILKPKRTRGRWRNQSEPENREPRADLREQWKPSIMPLLWGLKTVIVEAEIQKGGQTPAQTEEGNWAPLETQYRERLKHRILLRLKPMEPPLASQWSGQL